VVFGDLGGGFACIFAGRQQRPALAGLGGWRSVLGEALARGVWRGLHGMPSHGASREIQGNPGKSNLIGVIRGGSSSGLRLLPPSRYRSALWGVRIRAVHSMRLALRAVRCAPRGAFATFRGALPRSAFASRGSFGCPPVSLPPPLSWRSAAPDISALRGALPDPDGRSCDLTFAVNHGRPMP